MKALSAAVLGVAALALQASAAPLRVDVFVASPASPIPVEDALKHTNGRPNVPVRIPGYGFVSAAGEAVRHPTVQGGEAQEKKLHWVYRPAAGEEGIVNMSEAGVSPYEQKQAFRHWVMTHPDIQHDDGIGHLRLRPVDPSHMRGMRHGCEKSWKNPFTRLANSLREALGFAPVAQFRPHARPHHPSQTTDMMFTDGVVFGSYDLHEKDDRMMRRPDSRWPMPFHHQGQGRHHRFHHHRGGDWHKKPFSRRVMHALYILGPVEGRIVAFVLGLGIGALIRVVFVMGVLAFRSLSGHNRRIMLSEEDELPEPIVVERVYEIREKEEAPAYTAVVKDGEKTLAPPS